MTARLAPFGAMVVASVALHAAAFAAVGRLPAAPPRGPAPEPVEVAFDVAPPPPPPAPAPAAPRHVAAAALPAVSRRAPDPSLPPPNAPPPPDAPRTRPAVRVGVSLSSTTRGGAFAVGVGNTLYGSAGRTAADPAAVEAYAAGGTATERLSSLPRPLSIPRIVYPERARREGVAGRVVLLLRIGADGAVTEVRVLAEPGEGLGEAAREGARRFRFSPAVLDGTPVATTIRFTYTFVLD